MVQLENLIALSVLIIPEIELLHKSNFRAACIEGFKKAAEACA